MSVERLIQLMENRGLLGPKLLRQLRAAAADPNQGLTPERITKLLVQQGRITPAQAQALHADLFAGERGGESSELGLAEEDSSSALFPSAAEEEPQLFELDDSADTEDLSASAELGLAGQAPSAQPIPPPPQPQSIPPTAPAPPKRVGRKSWDSPVILAGGGALVLLVLAGGLLFFFLRWESGDELFRTASEDYGQGLYRPAIEKYETFLRQFPRHQKSSTAQVRLALARIWDVIDGRQDWEQAVALARQTLPKIKTEAAFADDGRPALASILPNIYEGFVERAEAANSPDEARLSLEQARAARALIDNSEYLPTSFRETVQPRIAELEERLSVVEREVDRDVRLAAAIEQIARKLEDKDSPAAYRVYQELIATYPAARSNPNLSAAVLDIVRAEKDLVMPLPAKTLPRPEKASEEWPQIAFSIRHTKTAEWKAAREQQLVFFIRGAILGVDAATGQLLWRRFLGVEPSFGAVWIEQPNQGGLLVGDTRSYRLLRLDAKDGGVVWSHPVGEPFYRPVVSDGTVWYCTESGKVVKLEAGQGQVAGGVQLPQSVRAPPCLDRERQLLFLTAQHTTLFALDSGSLEAKATMLLGHEKGSVSTPMSLLSGTLIVAQNVGQDHALLHAVMARESDAGELQLRQASSPQRIAGRVLAPMLVSENRFVQATDRGSLYLMEVVHSSDNVLRQIAFQAGTADAPTVVHAAMIGPRLFVGSRRLAGYSVLIARGELRQDWIQFDGDAFDSVRAIGNVLIHSRRSKHSSGTTITASRLDDKTGRPTPIWSTEVSIRLATEPISVTEPSGLLAVTSRGVLFHVDKASLSDGIADTPLTTGDLAPPSGAFFRTSSRDNRWIVLESHVNGPAVLLVDAQSWPPRVIHLPIDLDLPNASDFFAVPAEQGMLVPNTLGELHLLEATTGDPQMPPYQPALVPGAKNYWVRPSLVRGLNDTFLAVNATGEIHLIGPRTTPVRHLASLGTIPLAPAPPETIGVAASGRTGYAFVRGVEGDQVLCVELATLVLRQTVPVPGRIVRGPIAVDRFVLIETAGPAQLLCFTGSANLAWKTPLPHGTTVGRPYITQDTMIWASANGRLWQIDSRTGQARSFGVRATFDARQPLDTGPVVFGQRIVVGSYDGTLLMMNLAQS